MCFEQNLSKKYILIQLILNFAKRQNLQCELWSIRMNASNEEEVSESFTFAFYLLKHHIHFIHTF